MIDPEKFTFVIRKTEEDEEEPYVARVIEFPYLATYGKTPEAAYEAAVDAIRSFEEEKTAIPNPLPNIFEFSGRISLRIPKSLHRKLATYAEVEGVSINQYLGNILSWASGRYYIPQNMISQHLALSIFRTQLSENENSKRAFQNILEQTDRPGYSSMFSSASQYQNAMVEI